MTSRDDDLDLLGNALKGDGSESPMKARERKKEAEFTAKLLEGDAKAKVPDDRYLDLDGDGITWVDKEYDEMPGEVPFYDKPNANADYEHWGKVASYSSAEAAALLLEKAPEVVTPESIKSFIQESDFPKKYMQMYTLIDRAASMGELTSTSSLIQPSHLLEWAKRKNINIPSGLISAIDGRSKNIEIEEQKTDGVQKPDDVLSKSEYWLKLHSIASKAAKEYPDWHRVQARKVQTTSILDWLRKTYGANFYDVCGKKFTEREALVIKYVLQDIHPDIVPSNK
ncbi:MAG: hypothetical protein KZQ92_16230 [Candidatus Thiodiazotropha sp. (ex Lucinoma borealis)]|nr:hypothetical protein [Candidatus Thiodiazotropha sp. (ex Lucinoma borealis)]